MANKTSKILTEEKSDSRVAENIAAFDETSLIERCQQGQVEAFGQLVTAYQDRTYNVVMRMGNSPEDAEEITQEAFLKAFEKIATFKGGSTFYTWLFRIATNLAISRRRRAKKISFYSLSGTSESADSDLANARTSELAAKRVTTPDESALKAETTKRIEAALAELDDSYRIVVVLRDIEGMDYSMIANVLELPPGTIKSRLHRARGLLREKLADLVKEK